jgi:hypothetical protein
MASDVNDVIERVARSHMMRFAEAHSKQTGLLGGIVIRFGGFRNCDGLGVDAPSGNNSIQTETI